MRRVRIILFLVLIGQIVLMMTACKNSTSDEANSPSIQFNIEQVETTNGEESESTDKTPKAQPEQTAIYKVVLEQDEETASLMATNLVAELYDADHTDTWTWNANDFTTYYHIDDGWMMSYGDSTRSTGSGAIVDDDLAHMSEFGYITSITPNLLDFDAMSASDQACEFLKPYSSQFTFQPFRTLAGNVPGDEQTAGYYEVHLQACYDGIPICIYSDVTPINATVCVGQKGVFQCEGNFLYREVSREEIANAVSESEVANQLKESYLSISDDTNVEINNIQLQYVFSDNQDGTYTLEPVWAITGTASFTEGGTEYTRSVAYLYYAEDGSFCGLYSLVV